MTQQAQQIAQTQLEEALAQAIDLSAQLAGRLESKQAKQLEWAQRAQQVLSEGPEPVQRRSLFRFNRSIIGAVLAAVILAAGVMGATYSYSTVSLLLAQVIKTGQVRLSLNSPPGLVIQSRNL